MIPLDKFETRDGFGDYLWDRVLWLLAPGACVVLVGLAILLKQLTPVPLGGGVPTQRISMPAEPEARGATAPHAAPDDHAGHGHGPGEH